MSTSIETTPKKRKTEEWHLGSDTKRLKSDCKNELNAETPNQVKLDNITELSYRFSKDLLNRKSPRSKVNQNQLVDNRNNPNELILHTKSTRKSEPSCNMNPKVVLHRIKITNYMKCTVDLVNNQLKEESKSASKLLSETKTISTSTENRLTIDGSTQTVNLVDAQPSKMLKDSTTITDVKAAQDNGTQTDDILDLEHKKYCHKMIGAWKNIPEKLVTIETETQIDKVDYGQQTEFVETNDFSCQVKFPAETTVTTDTAERTIKELQETVTSLKAALLKPYAQLSLAERQELVRINGFDEINEENASTTIGIAISSSISPPINLRYSTTIVPNPELPFQQGNTTIHPNMSHQPLLRISVEKRPSISETNGSTTSVENHCQREPSHRLSQNMNMPLQLPIVTQPSQNLNVPIQLQIATPPLKNKNVPQMPIETPPSQNTHVPIATQPSSLPSPVTFVLCSASNASHNQSTLSSRASKASQLSSINLALSNLSQVPPWQTPQLHRSCTAPPGYQRIRRPPPPYPMMTMSPTYLHQQPIQSNPSVQQQDQQRFQLKQSPQMQQIPPKPLTQQLSPQHLNQQVIRCNSNYLENRSKTTFTPKQQMNQELLATQKLQRYHQPLLRISVEKRPSISETNGSTTSVENHCQREPSHRLSQNMNMPLQLPIVTQPSQNLNVPIQLQIATPPLKNKNVPQMPIETPPSQNTHVSIATQPSSLPSPVTFVLCSASNASHNQSTLSSRASKASQLSSINLALSNLSQVPPWQTPQLQQWHHMMENNYHNYIRPQLNIMRPPPPGYQHIQTPPPPYPMMTMLNTNLHQQPIQSNTSVQQQDQQRFQLRQSPQMQQIPPKPLTQQLSPQHLNQQVIRCNSNHLENRSNTTFTPKQQMNQELLAMQRYHFRQQQEARKKEQAIRREAAMKRKEASDRDKALKREEASRRKVSVKSKATLKREEALKRAEERQKETLSNGLTIRHALLNQPIDLQQTQQLIEENMRQEAQQRQAEVKQSGKEETKHRKVEKRETDTKKQTLVKENVFYCLICREGASSICDTCHNITCCSNNKCYEQIQRQHEQQCPQPQMKLISNDSNSF